VQIRVLFTVSLIIVLLAFGAYLINAAGTCDVSHEFTGATKWWWFFEPQGAAAEIMVRDVDLECTSEGLVFSNAWAMVASGDCSPCYIQSGLEVNNDPERPWVEPVAFSPADTLGWQEDEVQ